MYHYIRNNPDPRDRLGFRLSVRPADFTAQMKWAHDHGWHAVTLADLRDALAGRRQLAPKSMVLTFDDGYADFHSAAMPVLQADGFVAVSYVVTGLVGKPGFMTWDDILDADRHGIILGSHTIRHLDLTRLRTDSARLEVGGSKAQLEAKLGHAVADFCYPSGRHNRTVEDLVRTAGYLDATTTVFGAAESSSDAMRWPRLRVQGGDSLTAFAAELEGRVRALPGQDPGDALPADGQVTGHPSEADSTTRRGRPF
jgi:peptidoglycan/xylan/chitin deacetylase (PgdA/CDA1 family)